MQESYNSLSVCTHTHTHTQTRTVPRSSGQLVLAFFLAIVDSQHFGKFDIVKLASAGERSREQPVNLITHVSLDL